MPHFHPNPADMASDDQSYEFMTDTSSSSTDWLHQKQADHYYWLGKKMMEFCISGHVLRTANNLDSITEIEAKVLSIMAQFPLAKQLGFLRNGISPDLKNHRVLRFGSEQRASLAIVGLIEVLGSVSDKMCFDESWRSQLRRVASSRDSLGGGAYGGGDKAGMDEDSSPMDSAGRDQGPSPARDEMRSSDTSSMLPRYVMALKEHGDVKRMTPQYQEKMMTVDPPLWFCRLRFEGREFLSRASSKKHARHLTARQACDALGIEI